MATTTQRLPSASLLAVPLDRSNSRTPGFFFGLPSSGLPIGVQSIVAAGVQSYKNALGGRTELSASSYYTIEEKAKKIIDMRKRLQNMIENSDNEQLIVNLTMLHSNLDDTLEEHEDMLQRFLQRRAAIKEKEEIREAKRKSSYIQKAYKSFTAEAELSLNLPRRDSSASLLSSSFSSIAIPSSSSSSSSTASSAIQNSTFSSSSPLVSALLSSSNSNHFQQHDFCDSHNRLTRSDDSVILSQKARSLEKLNGNGEASELGGELKVSRPLIARKERLVDCPICYNECPVRELYTFLGCSHFYCFDCLRSYYQTALDEGRVLLLRCPTPGCKTEVHPGDMEAVMKHEWVEKFEDFALLAMLRLDVNTRWCPKVDCGASITVDPESTGEVECPKCHTLICSECGRLHHPGKTCQEEASLVKSEDIQLEEWAKNRAKKCPGCGALTEKYHGCNHMTCISCSHQWCWLCLQVYDENHYAEGSCGGKQFSSEQDPEYEDADPYDVLPDEEGVDIEQEQLEQWTQRRHHRRWRNIHARIGLCVAGVVAAPVVAPVVVAVVLYGALKYLVMKPEEGRRDDSRFT